MAHWIEGTSRTTGILLQVTIPSTLCLHFIGKQGMIITSSTKPIDTEPADRGLIHFMLDTNLPYPNI